MDLRKQIGLSKWLVGGIFVVIVGSYLITFRELPHGGPGAWGEFGDYVGGVMNPLIAFAAFYWVATSVMLQKDELTETRAALVATQLEQKKQADTALHAAQIQTLNIKLSVTSAMLAQMEAYRAQLFLRQGFSGPAGSYWNEDGVETSLGQVIAALQCDIRQVTEQHAEIIKEIDSLAAQFLAAWPR